MRGKGGAAHCHFFLHFAQGAKRNGAFRGKKRHFSGQKVPLLATRSGGLFIKNGQALDNKVVAEKLQNIRKNFYKFRV